MLSPYQPYGPGARKTGYIGVYIYVQHGLAAGVAAGAFVASSSETRAFVCTGTEAVIVVVRCHGDMVLVMVGAGKETSWGKKKKEKKRLTQTGGLGGRGGLCLSCGIRHFVGAWVGGWIIQGWGKCLNNKVG